MALDFFESGSNRWVAYDDSGGHYRIENIGGDSYKVSRWCSGVGMACLKEKIEGYKEAAKYANEHYEAFKPRIEPTKKRVKVRKVKKDKEAKREYKFFCIFTGIPC